MRGSSANSRGDNLMQIKKAVSISLLLATIVVVVVLMIANRNERWRKPHQERDEFHFVVKAAEWDLHATKVCVFFGSGFPTAQENTVGCWDKEDGHDFVNREDKPNDHLYSVDIDAPNTTQVQLGQGHNAKLYCVRTEWTHLVCDPN